MNIHLEGISVGVGCGCLIQVHVLVLASILNGTVPSNQNSTSLTNLHLHVGLVNGLGRTLPGDIQS